MALLEQIRTDLRKRYIILVQSMVRRFLRNKRLANNAIEVKSITNIYYDCLERIFAFLDLENLLNVAQTCKRLQTAAAYNFYDRFGRNRIRFFPFWKNRTFNYRPENIIDVCGQKLSLRFLRCFGGKISKIDQFTECNYINQYISKYCANELSSIYFKTIFPKIAFQCPFKNIEKVVIELRDFNTELMDLLTTEPP